MPGYQDRQYQAMKEHGPVPEGQYKVDLKKSFLRDASTVSSGGTTPSTGVTFLPWLKNGFYYD